MTKLSNGAKLVGTAGHCKNAAFIIGDTVFAVQGHPEFDAPRYTDALVGLLADRVGENDVKWPLNHCQHRMMESGLPIGFWHFFKT